MTIAASASSLNLCYRCGIPPLDEEVRQQPSNQLREGWAVPCQTSDNVQEQSMATRRQGQQ